jgi:NADH:quinone reductase (non-electrogenic)
MATDKPVRVLVLGAGFGGLTFCETFRHPRAEVTVVDKTNHHLFQPLLYQVATAGLSAPDIAQPVRSILSKVPRLQVVLDEVQDVDLAGKKVTCRNNTFEYDYLLLAVGSITSYFGHTEWQEHAYGLKTLDDALAIRDHILMAFEKAENTTDPKQQQRLMTIVVVGGGPTGVELAGACAELAEHVLAHDFDRIDPARSRIIVIEASPVVLNHLPDDLAHKAQQQLEGLGVKVMTSTRVKDIRKGEVQFDNGETIYAETILWAAGVMANPLTKKLGVPLDRGGRIIVNPDLSVPGHPEVFAIGDMVTVPHKDGKPVPWVSPAAMQMGKHVARLIEHELEYGVGGTAPSQTPRREGAVSPTPERPAFKYWDKGTMATIGRSAAVALIGKVKLSGYIAWLAWLFIHLVFLIGLRNKAIVLFNWTYSYFTYKRGARIITGADRHMVS